MIADEPILLLHVNSPELQFVLANKIALKKNTSTRLNYFNDACPGYPHFYNIPDGKSDWLISSEHYIFFCPDSHAIRLPWYLGDESPIHCQYGAIQHNFLLDRIKPNQIYGI
ncbi:MAG: hypothetical protein ABIN01_13130 [Ferruginibacter sp.]